MRPHRWLQAISDYKGTITSAPNFAYSLCTKRIKPRERALIAVNLYSGNHYWFSVGANEQAKKLAVAVYDETGQQVTTESYNAGEKAAAGFSPTNSGQYFVSVGLVEGEESSVCFLYSYK